MSQHLIAMFAVAVLGQFPGGGAGGTPYGGGAVYSAPDSTHAFGSGDPTHPYDFEPNWAHGYYQEIPAYHGHHLFRPYNYKHVMPQSQTAAAWGIPPQMPISHSNFNFVNGVPTTYLPIRPVRPGAEDLRSQFAKIDRQVSVPASRRPGPDVRQSGYQEFKQVPRVQPRQLTRKEQLRLEIDRLNAELEREEVEQ